MTESVRNDPATDLTAAPSAVSLAQAFGFWLKLGFISFGGPAGQIAIMHNELVERRRWISEKRFLHALNYCMVLPGPEAQQLATYIGWLMHRGRGGLVAGGLFVLPSLFIQALSWVSPSALRATCPPSIGQPFQRSRSSRRSVLHLRPLLVLTAACMSL